MVAESTVTLRQAATRYAATLPSADRGVEQPAVEGFVRWCGRDRSAEELTPQEIEQYGSWVTNEGSDPTAKLVSVRSFLTNLRKKKIVQGSLATHLRVPRTRRQNQQRPGLPDPRLRSPLRDAPTWRPVWKRCAASESQ